jgi:hypothetical protein
MNFIQIPLPYLAETFLATHYIKRIAKNPLFEVISFQGTTGPPIIQVLMSLLLDTVTANEQGEHKNINCMLDDIFSTTSF